MAVDVKSVSDRRKVHYDSLRDLVADVERLAAGHVRTIGNRSFGQILGHLTLVMNNSIDGKSSALGIPWHIRIAARLLRKQILARGLRPGFNLPEREDARMWPAADQLSDAVEGLRKAVHRLETETKRNAHPAFGAMNVDEWNQFHLRHSELHMSFVLPE
jgi:hypothetical protein